jgi:virginiamycin B lyase
MKATLLFFGLTASLLAQQIAITVYPTLTEHSGPMNITSGPDGNVWFTEEDNTSNVARITPAGTVTEYPTPTPNSGPAGITTGPDGALWFAEYWANQIGRITTAGAITEYPIPLMHLPNNTPSGITAGRDGALWFTEQAPNQIGRMTTTGTVTQYPIPTAHSLPGPIVSGPDGALWFTEEDGNNIGRITTGGAFTEYPVPTPRSEPQGITVGPDGALWFTEFRGGNIGRITTEGAITEYPAAGGLSGITTGPDGLLWFCNYAANTIGSISTAGVLSEYPLPDPGSEPGGITTGADGSLWFAEYGTNLLGQGVFPTATVSATPSSGVYQSQVSFTGSGFEPGESVLIYTAGVGSTVLSSATADSNGTFSATGNVPVSIYGPRLFFSTGQTSGRLGAANFSMKPSLIMNPDAGPVGSLTTPEGYGFPSFAPVAIYWDNPLSLIFYVFADYQGSFTGSATAPFAVPSGAAPGANVVFGQEHYGGEQRPAPVGIAIFTVQ